MTRMKHQYPALRLLRRALLLLTLQQLGVYEQLQRQQQHHHDHAGHQDTVEARRQQAHLPQRRPAAAARLQPVGPEQRVRG